MKIISLAVVVLLTLGTFKPAHNNGELASSWPTRSYIYQGPGYVYPDFHPALNFSYDIIVTEINFSIPNIPKNAVSDWGINIARNVNPLLPHVTAVNSEIIGLHSSWHGSGGTWAKIIDLSKTPLYIAAGTDINCFAPVFNATLQNNMTLDCGIKYHIYIPGEPRYRSLRFPFVDMQNTPSGAMAENWYKSGDATGQSFNLPIGGWIAFTSFNGINITANASSICLKTYTSPGGNLTGSDCTSNQNITINQNFSNSSISKTYTPNWYVSPGQYLTATCQMSVSGDCAIWLFVLLRENISVNAKSVIDDYDAVPISQLSTYCNTYASEFTHNWFGVTTSEKISNCNKLFDIVTTTPIPTPTTTKTATATSTLAPTPTPTPIYTIILDCWSDHCEIRK